MSRTQQQPSGQVVELQKRVDAQQNSFVAELEEYSSQFAQALPSNVPVDRFKRVLLTAVATNPDLLYANRRTFYTSAVRCAADGLMPDGREAALVVYNTKVKQRDPATGLDVERRIDAVQYLPMVAGIRKRMRNTGDVLIATAEVVYSNDKFRYSLGDTPFIEHEPAGIAEERGTLIGAYAIIRLRSGEILRDVMRLSEIEKSRGQGRAPNSLMWQKFYDEGARKTVLRRCSKAAPQSAEFEAMLGRDEELAELPDHTGAGERPSLGDFSGLPDDPEPTRPTEQQQQQPGSVTTVVGGENRGEDLFVIDLEGESFSFPNVESAGRAMQALFQEAARRGLQSIEGAYETNAPALREMNTRGAGAMVEALNTEYKALRDQLTRQQPTTAVEALHRQQTTTAGAQGSPQTSETSGGTKAAAEGEQANSAAAGATAAAAEPDRTDSYEIIPPLRSGKADLRTWALALFIPKLKQIVDDGERLAFFLGDNNVHLEAAKKILGPDERQQVESAIDDQWKRNPTK